MKHKHKTILTQTIAGPIYRATDLTGMKFSFKDIILVLAEETKAGFPGSAGDPRVALTLVATGELATLIQQAADQEQYGGKDIQIFATQAEALAYVRAKMAEENRRTG